MSVNAVQVLLARPEQLSPRAGAAITVLQLVNDPDTGAQDLARAIGADPVFAARMLRVANSSYYGLSGRVSTLPFAVSVVGFQVVRSLAAVAAAGLDAASAAPPGFWDAAAATAAGAELVARIVGADPGDAFSAGLLHLIGTAVLHRHQPLDRICLPEPDDLEASLAVEDEAYGIAHDEAGAAILTAWHLPEQLCALVGQHHQPVMPQSGPLERCLAVARLLAGQVVTDGPGAVPATLAEQVTALSEGRVGEADLPVLLERTHDRAQSLLNGLAGR